MGTAESTLMNGRDDPSGQGRVHPQAMHQPPRFKAESVNAQGASQKARKQGCAVSISSGGGKGKPSLKMNGVIMGGPQTGKQSFLQRMKGKNPFVEDMDVSTPKEQAASFIRIPYKPPMPGSDRIQLQIETAASREYFEDLVNHKKHTVNFGVLLVHPQHDWEHTQTYIYHVLVLLLQQLGYSGPTSSEEEEYEDSEAARQKNEQQRQQKLLLQNPLCLCVCLNFADLQADDGVTVAHLQDFMANIFQTRLQVEFDIPAPHKIVIDIVSISLKNNFGLAHVHWFIYHSYLRYKEILASRELHAIHAQLHKFYEKQPNRIDYSKFVKLVEREQGSEHSNKTIQQSPDAVTSSSTDKGREHTKNDKESLRRSDSPDHAKDESQIGATDSTTSRKKSKEQKQKAKKQEEERNARTSKRRNVVKSQTAQSTAKMSLEDFLASSSDEEQQQVATTTRKSKSKRKSQKANKTRTPVADDSSDDDDAFFFDGKGNRILQTTSYSDSDDGSSDDSSASSAKQAPRVPKEGTDNTSLSQQENETVVGAGSDERPADQQQLAQGDKYDTATDNDALPTKPSKKAPPSKQQESQETATTSGTPKNTETDGKSAESNLETNKPTNHEKVTSAGFSEDEGHVAPHSSNDEDGDVENTMETDATADANSTGDGMDSNQNINGEAPVELDSTQAEENADNDRASKVDEENVVPDNTSASSAVEVVDKIAGESHAHSEDSAKQNTDTQIERSETSSEAKETGHDSPPSSESIALEGEVAVEESMPDKISASASKAASFDVLVADSDADDDVFFVEELPPPVAESQNGHHVNESSEQEQPREEKLDDDTSTEAAESSDSRKMSATPTDQIVGDKSTSSDGSSHQKAPTMTSAAMAAIAAAQQQAELMLQEQTHETEKARLKKEKKAKKEEKKAKKLKKEKKKKKEKADTRAE